MFSEMNDIKSVVSVIKILERTIGVLENCSDLGGIPDSTRKRLIEMLNKATLEIYFLNDSSEEKISKTGIKSEKEQALKTPEIIEIAEEVDEIMSEEDIIIDESVPEAIPEDKLIEIISNEETPMEEEFVEETADEKDVIENISGENEENTVSEDVIFNQQDNLSDKPLFEWEIDVNPVQETQEVEETQENDINLLKFQLEEERRRLEQELQNWQDERRKRDEEILAAKKLLESLQQQTALNQAKQQSVTKQSQPVAQLPKQSQPVTQQQPKQSQPVAQQPKQSVQTEPLIRREAVKEPIKKEEPHETLIDRFIGTKKVLHENYEGNNMVNQISTPVANLSRAIGINDRFRFIKELFGGDSDLYNETIKRIDTIGSLVSAIAYIESNFSWDKNSDSVKQLISLIRRRYM
jgi:hypothetical protein